MSGANPSVAVGPRRAGSFPSPMDEVYQVLLDIINRRRKLLLMPDANKAVRDYFLTLLTGPRLYLFRDKIQFEEEWAKIRGSLAVVDFLINVTNELHVRLSCHEINFERLTEILAKAYGQHSTPEVRNSYVHRAIDKDMLDRLPEPISIERHYQHNSWFVPLLLCDHISTGILQGWNDPTATPAA